MKRMQMFLPEPMIAKLKALAKKNNVSVAYLIRYAVDDSLLRRRPKDLRVRITKN